MPTVAAGEPGPGDEAVTATMLGPWPGTDPVEAVKVSLGLLSQPHLPALPELPSRGVGSDAVGRTASLLLELPVDVQPYGWRFADHSGLDQRRGASALSTDINVLADVAGGEGLSPAALKVQVVGPFSLAAAIHLHYGERSLRDHGARRDIADSLAEGLSVHADKLRLSVPGAALTLQVDEPAISAVLAGTIPTASGYRTLRSIPQLEIRRTWGELVAAAQTAGFAEVAINLAPATQLLLDTTGESADDSRAAERAAWRRGLETALECGASAVAVPLNVLDGGHWEMLAQALEAGMGVWAGTVPVSAGRVPPSYAHLAERIMRPWHGLGLEAALLRKLRITPHGGLAVLTPGEARTVLQRTLDVAQQLSENVRN